MVKEVKPWESESKRSKYSLDVLNDIIKYRIVLPLILLAVFFLIYFFGKYGLAKDWKVNILFIILILVLFLMQGRHIKSWIERMKRK